MRGVPIGPQQWLAPVSPLVGVWRAFECFGRALSCITIVHLVQALYIVFRLFDLSWIKEHNEISYHHHTSTTLAGCVRLLLRAGKWPANPNARATLSNLPFHIYYIREYILVVYADIQCVSGWGIFPHPRSSTAKASSSLYTRDLQRYPIATITCD